MFHLRLQNVRCFVDSGQVRVAPLTLLVGENSTGKTSFLALSRIALGFLGENPESTDFNHHPFSLGAYDQIAHRYSNGDISSQFSIEASHKALNHESVQRIGYFQKANDQPYLKEFAIEGPGGGIDKVGEEISVSFADGRGWLNLDDILSRIKLPPGSEGSQIDNIAIATAFKALSLLKHLYPSSDSGNGHIYHPHPISPIRSEPKRTYDPITDAFSPDGRHVPMLMAAIARKNPEKWKNFKASLEKFGRDAGLFDKIDVKKLGDSDSDPFQVEVAINNLKTNLVDVGYGVSQVLPIITDLLYTDEKTKKCFLVQQPEVHLHPKAQAGLGSFLLEYANSTENIIIAETHSDYIIDRVRMDIRDKKISPDKVSILYFERIKDEVKIHQLDIDEQGNLLNTPENYRDFFARETNRFLGLDDDD